MSIIKSQDENLTLNAHGSGNDIKFQSNGVEKASISDAGLFTSTTIDATKLTGALPAISGAALTGVGVAGITSAADATAITIDSSENVGIGTTSPSTLLHLKSTSADKPILRIQNTLNHGVDDDPSIEFYADDTNQSGIADNTNIGTIRFKGDDKDGGSNHDYAEIVGVMADPGGTYRGAINFKIANGSAPATITRIDKDGLKFGTDTAAANALDDYEEGTWTPALNGGSTPQASAPSGTYVKVGTLVTCYFMWWGFTATAVAAQITGLPFTSKSGTYVTATIGSNTWTNNGASAWGYNANTLRVVDCVNKNEATGIAGYPRYISMSITYRTT